MPIIKQKPVPQESRKQIVEMFLQNPDQEAIARKFKVSKQTVTNFVNAYFNSKPAFQAINQPAAAYFRDNKKDFKEMPTVRPKKKNPKVGLNENAPITSGWDKAIEGRKKVWCEERKATVYVKN